MLLLHSNLTQTNTPECSTIHFHAIELGAIAPSFPDKTSRQRVTHVQPDGDQRPERGNWNATGVCRHALSPALAALQSVLRGQEGVVLISSWPRAVWPLTSAILPTPPFPLSLCYTHQLCSATPTFCLPFFSSFFLFFWFYSSTNPFIMNSLGYSQMPWLFFFLMRSTRWDQMAEAAQGNSDTVFKTIIIIIPEEKRQKLQLIKQHRFWLLLDDLSYNRDIKTIWDIPASQRMNPTASIMWLTVFECKTLIISSDINGLQWIHSLLGHRLLDTCRNDASYKISI